MLHSFINRRDALLASAGLVVAATAPSSAQPPPQSTIGTAILKSQSLAPLMGAPVELGTAPNGAIFNKVALDAHAKTFPPRRETVKVTDNIWVIQDPSAASAFIVGNDGVIVWDTGDNLEDGKYYRAEIRKVTDKPIKAVMYSHSHEVLGTSAVIEGEKDVLIIGHPNVNTNLQTSGVGAYFPETEPLQWARVYEYFNAFLPNEGPDAKWGITVALGERGFVPVNHPVKNGEELTVAGIRFQFFTEGSTDSNDTMTVWMPDQKVALNNVLWPYPPNIYTPRGALWRDPRAWRDATRVLRDLQPEMLIGQPTLPLKGKDAIFTHLNNYIDFSNLMLDQTLRGILKGLGPEDLIDFVQLPQHLQNDPYIAEIYGLFCWYPPYIAEYALGWWDGDAATLFRLPPKESALRLVPALGGRDKVLALARNAQQKREYAWALELVGYLWRIDPNDTELRQLKTDLLRTAAQLTTSMIARALSLTEALALEGKAKVPRLVPPTVEQIKSFEPGEFVNRHRIRIDPIKAKDTDAMIRFEFTDANNKAVALHVRRGVVEYVDNPDRYYRKPDFTLTLTREVWTKLYLNQATVAQLAGANELKVAGDAAACVGVLDLFDKFDPAKNTLVAPSNIGRL
jgi:alkyl sulfatase BDS1-like metallo-beta-lactamase superfamily hydrolase